MGTTTYIERHFATLNSLIEQLKEKHVFFIGPALCGKTTTLRALYHKMYSQGKVVEYINLVSMPLDVLQNYTTSSSVTYFIENAQVLADPYSDIAIHARFLLDGMKNKCCFDFSPVVPGYHGYSIDACNIRGAHNVFFGPFSEEEFEKFKNNSNVTLDPNVVGYIPGVLSCSATLEEAESKMRRHVSNTLNKVARAITYDASRENSLKVHLALRKLINYGCINLSNAERDLLLFTGFCWADSQTVKQVFPVNIVRQQLSSVSDTVRSELLTFYTGAALEYAFLTVIRNGITARCMNAPAGSEDMSIEIPSTTEKVWIQPSYGEVPQQFSGCLVVKLAQNHCAVDFLIVDSTPIGANNKRLYFVQVSAKAYTERATDDRYCAIERSFSQLNGKSPLNLYSQKLNIKKDNCYFLYATSSSSTSVGSETERVYKVKL